MLKPFQISEQIAQLQDHNLSLEDFEQWFRRESRNFHRYADERLREAIFALEGVLSEYHFAGLSEESTASELAAAIRPFEKVSIPQSFVPELASQQSSNPDSRKGPSPAVYSGYNHASNSNAVNFNIASGNNAISGSAAA